MNVFQGIIKIDKGKITSLKNITEDSIAINVEGQEYLFKNAYAYPGFVDAHGHIASLGKRLNGLDLSKAKSAEECCELASKHNFTQGGWLLGYGWNNENWIIKEFPTAKLLDSKFKDIPVAIMRIDGHCVWVNSCALKLAGITNNTPNPIGGEIVRYKNGTATGILVDNAINLVSSHIPKPTKSELIANIERSLNSLLASGLTEVNDMDVNPDIINILSELDLNNKLPIRINSFIRAQNYEWLSKDILPQKFNKLNICGIKIFFDGALGSRGAAMIEPYSDDIEAKGLLLLDFQKAYSICQKALEQGFQIAAHSIGDSAVRLGIEVYEKIRAESQIGKTVVLRMEHCQHFHPTDIKRFADCGIIASVQPLQCISDIEMAEKRINKERCKYAYLWKTLKNFGITLTAGSDFPIESHKPLLGISAFVSRKDKRTNKEWFPEEILSRQEALGAFTYDSHKALCTDNRGKIDIGFDGDITILDTNLLSCNDSEIEGAKVIAVFVGGKRMF